MAPRACYLLSGLLLASLAHAQLDMGGSGPPAMDMGSIILNQQLLKGVMERNQEARDAGTKGSAAAAPLTYRATASVTEKVKRDYLVRARKAYGTNVADGIRRLLAQKDFRAEWTKACAPDGMRPGDLADSVAEYWTYNWMVANGVPSLSPAHVKALRFEIGPAMARNLSVRRLTNAQKQEISESLMLDAYVLAVCASAAAQKNDPTVSAKLRMATNARFRQAFGIDLTTIRLTPRGVVRSARG